MMRLYQLVFKPNPSIFFSSKPLRAFHMAQIAPRAKLSIAGARLIFGRGENNICHVDNAYEMLASNVCYRARVCVGSMLGRVSMWVHPWQGIHMEFARVNAYNENARYKSLIARENIARRNITRQLLQEYDFTIQHKFGMLNTNADGLSQNHLQHQSVDLLSQIGTRGITMWLQQQLWCLWQGTFQTQLTTHFHKTFGMMHM